MFELVNVCKTLKTFLTFEAFHHFAMFKYLTYVNVKYVQARNFSAKAQSYIVYIQHVKSCMKNSFASGANGQKHDAREKFIIRGNTPMHPKII